MAPAQLVQLHVELPYQTGGAHTCVTLQPVSHRGTVRCIVVRDIHVSEGPAALLQRGDTIVEIDGQRVDGSSLAHVDALINTARDTGQGHNLVINHQKSHHEREQHAMWLYAEAWSAWRRVTGNAWGRRPEDDACIWRHYKAVDVRFKPASVIQFNDGRQEQGLAPKCPFCECLGPKCECCLPAGPIPSSFCTYASFTLKSIALPHQSGGALSAIGLEAHCNPSTSIHHLVVAGVRAECPLRVGDAIVGIENQSVNGKSVESIHELIMNRARANESLALTIQRNVPAPTVIHADGAPRGADGRFLGRAEIMRVKPDKRPKKRNKRDLKNWIDLSVPDAKAMELAAIPATSRLPAPMTDSEGETTVCERPLQWRLGPNVQPSPADMLKVLNLGVPLIYTMNHTGVALASQTLGCTAVPDEFMDYCALQRLLLIRAAPQSLPLHKNLPCLLVSYSH